MLRPMNDDRLAEAFQHAEPFPHIAIDDFLDPEFANELAAAYPTFAQAESQGQQFKAVNEYRKIQLSDSSKFPEPVKKLNELLASPEFIARIEHISGIPNLLPDPLLAGGGMHMTGPRGRLDVHVDFNLLEPQMLHRRLNLLVYLNPEWKREWGGAVEVWDEDVQIKHGAFPPRLNRVVMFATSEISFHGVEEVRCPVDRTRNSFAVYYYTKEAPPGYKGEEHTTIFKARPDEPLKKYVLMPAQELKNRAAEGSMLVRRAAKKLGIG